MSAALILNAVLAIFVVVGILSLLGWGVVSDHSPARRIGSNPFDDSTQRRKIGSRATATPPEFAGRQHLMAAAYPGALSQPSECLLTSANLPITIRVATQDDHLSLARLAALDSTEEVPAGRVLLGEVDGELRAALCLDDGSAIADPFHRTADLIELIRGHAMRVGSSRSRRQWLGLRYAAS
jgi:hypothetical protein